MSPRAVRARKGTEARRCTCGAPVLVALSSSGMDVTLDSRPLSAAGELAAVMAGVWTYSHHLVPDEVHVRGAWSINMRPAGTRPRQTIHATHTCGTRWPALVTPTPTAAAATGADDDAPPF